MIKFRLYEFCQISNEKFFRLILFSNFQISKDKDKNVNKYFYLLSYYNLIYIVNMIYKYIIYNIVFTYSMCKT